MDSNLIKRYFTTFKQMSRKRLLVYLLVAGAIAVSLTTLSIFKSRAERNAQEKFRLATSYYYQAENSKGKEKTEKYREAEALYREILSKFWVNKKDTLFYLGNCLHSLKEFEKAARVLKRFERKYTNDYFTPWVEIKLASIYEQKREYGKAIDFYNKVFEKYPQSCLAPQALLGAGRCLQLQEKWDKAQQNYEKLTSRYPLSKEKEMAQVKIQQLKQKSD
ncbi:MAG: tetratricopeptide repeat protein [Candidatus Aerophobetes bacterium]|nr:tetratricopeptide repeat protein [Candidatus Aerophobetes bacterium]